MRWSEPYTTQPLEETYDVFMSSAVGMAWVPGISKVGALGGSEWECELLVTELAKMGLKVGITSPIFYPTKSAGVDCWPLTELNKTVVVKTNILINLRGQQPPPGVSFQKMINWSTDNLSPDYQYLDTLPKELKMRNVCVSDFHLSQAKPSWNSRRIYNMVPDETYNLPKVKKDPNLYCYTSSAMKGLDETLNAWNEMRNHYAIKKAKLLVLSPGYDKPNEELLKKTKNVEFVGMLPFKSVVDVTSHCIGMFYVNKFPETFGISPLLAEITGTVPHILTLSHPGALPEVLNTKTVTNDFKTFQDNIMKASKGELVCQPPKDFRISTLIPQWVKALEDVTNE